MKIKELFETKIREADKDIIKTGKTVTFDYIHNIDSATKHYGKPDIDSEFYRGYEPSGMYVNIVTDKDKIDDNPKFIKGTITVNNPLVINNEDGLWKKKLSERYNKKTGKYLSKELIKDGYDAVITVDPKYISEILLLHNFDFSKAKY